MDGKTTRSPGVFFEPGTAAEIRSLAGSLLRHAALVSLAFGADDGGRPA
jgi:hypothetical protein